MLSDDQKSDLKLIDNSLNITDTKYKPLWEKWEQLYESEHDKAYLEKRKKAERSALFIPLTYSTVSIADSVFTTSFFGNGNPIGLKVPNLSHSLFMHTTKWKLKKTNTSL